MKILIATACWGEDYISTLTDFSVASLLSPDNVPKLSQTDEIIWQLIAPQADLADFRSRPGANRLQQYCSFEEISFESLGLDPRRIPRGINNEKYSFLSQLQSHAIRTSTGKDVIVFNYADFVWCDGSLAKCIEPLRDKSKDAMLTFCLPVDEWAGKHALRDFRRPDADAIVLPSRAGAALAIDNLHREARLRIWDSEEFTSAPSYVLWRVGDQGLILHAYHMTVLALRVMPNDPSFIGGIKEGSLDGYYSGIVAERWPFAIADDSDAVLVFSLYDTTVDSRESTGLSREEVLRWTAIQASPSQRELVLHPILLKRHFDDPAAWSQATRASAEILRRIHDITDRFSSIAVAQFVQRLLPRIYALLGSDVGRLLKLLAGRSLRNLIRGVVIRAHVRSELRLAPGKSFKNAPAATAPTTWKGREPVDRTDQWSSAQWISLFASGQIEEILKTFDPMPEGVIIMPSISVSGAAAARLRAAKFIEGLIGNINEDQTIGAVLQTRDLMLSQAIQIEPQWPELSDWRAANSFMIGRFSAATEDFNTAEAKRRTMALHAKLDPDKAVYLPRSCAFSIGLMTHFDGYVKHKILSGDQRPYLLLTNASSVVNPVFLSYWRDHIEVVTNSATVARLEQEEPALSPNWNWVLPGGDGRVDHIHKRIAAVQRQWEAEQRDPLLTLRESQRQALDEQKRQWGMSEDDWFVCLHVRSAGFYKESEGGANAFRNTQIEDYYPAIEAIVAAGGWVIRMGDTSMPQLALDRLPAGRVIDYALSAQKSALMDVALCASCRFVIAAPSGLAGVASSFGRPCVLVNYPVQVGLPWFPRDRFIFKRLYSPTKQRMLTLDEIFGSGIPYAITQHILNREQVIPVPNDPIDIAQLVREALEDPGEHTQRKGKAVVVRDRLAALNRQFDIGISGLLGEGFAEKYASELLGD